VALGRLLLIEKIKRLTPSGQLKYTAAAPFASLGRKVFMNLNKNRFLRLKGWKTVPLKLSSFR